MSDRIQPYDLTPCPYCGGEAYSFFNGEYEEDVDECTCSEKERMFIDAQGPLALPKSFDYEVLEDLVEKDILPHHPMGEKLDSWGVNSLQRTLFSDNKHKSSRIRKDVRKRVEGDCYLSA